MILSLVTSGVWYWCLVLVSGIGVWYEGNALLATLLLLASLVTVHEYFNSGNGEKTCASVVAKAAAGEYA